MRKRKYPLQIYLDDEEYRKLKDWSAASKRTIVDDFEYRVLIEALADRRNDFIAGEKPADDVSDLLLKVIDAPTKKEKKREREYEERS